MNPHGSREDAVGEGADSGRTVDVGIADYAVGGPGDVLATFGLGSCVAVAMYDPDAELGALAHVMLPRKTRDNGEEPPAGKFADTAVEAMLDDLTRLGADRSNLRAKIVGGSEMFDFSGIAEGVGRRNVETAERELRVRDIPVEATDVGGDHGRSVELEAWTGVVRLKTAADGVTEL